MTEVVRDCHGCRMNDGILDFLFKPAVEDLLVFSKNVIGATAWLHTHKIMHLDLKPENVLLLHGSAVLCDFGCAARLGKEHVEDVWGTVNFGCPEYIPSFAADLFSLGRLLQEMWLETELFPAPGIVREVITGCLMDDPS